MTVAAATGAKMRASLLAVVLAGALSAAAGAQTPTREWAWCRDHDPALLIRGCSAIIHAGRESPDNLSRAFYNRGRAYYDQGQYDPSVRDFDRAITLDPNYPDAFNNRALARAGLGQYEQAIADFDEAIRLDPNYAIAIYNRGIALQNMGRTDAAAKDFAKARDTGPRLTQPKE
jgi:tetratricopeptide (TPR) repeat protein